VEKINFARASSKGMPYSSFEATPLAENFARAAAVKHAHGIQNE